MVPTPPGTSIYFSDIFGISPSVLEEHGAFDISLVNDLPLFIDPFLLFNSEKIEYKSLHDEIIRYVCFLRDRALSENIDQGLLEAWFTFREVKETWLGYSKTGNRGSGLGVEFAEALKANLSLVFPAFGEDQITKGSHLEKLCLINSGVGRDSISDFTTNLIKPFLLNFSEQFAKKYLQPDQRKIVSIPKACFNYTTAIWESRKYELPYVSNEPVILTPIDILTKDDVWINKADLIRDYEHVASSISNIQLRSQLSRYFNRRLDEIRRRDEENRKARNKNSRFLNSNQSMPAPTQRQIDESVKDTVREHPEIIDYYIRYKEEHGEEAEARADENVRSTEHIFISQVRSLINLLECCTEFYEVSGDTKADARKRISELKRVIENGSARDFFCIRTEPITRDADLHLILRLAWCNVPPNSSEKIKSSLSISKRFSKTIVEFKLGSNSQLGKYFEKTASQDDWDRSVKAIICFSREEHAKTRMLLKATGLKEGGDITIIAA